LRVAHLSLTNFRNYAAAEVPFEAGPNLFVGRNGQGKTNLIESLGYLSTLGSHRVSTDQALIQQGFDAAVIRARVQNDAREALVEVQLNRTGANRAQVNRSAIRPRELPRYFSSVLFAPEDLALIRGEPGVRRRFMDQLLVQRNPRLAGVLSDYERVLKQRNTLLKSVRAAGLKGAQLSTLDIWDERLVSLGAEIIDARASLIERLRGPLGAAYHSVVGDDHSPRLREQLSILGGDPDEIENVAFSTPAYSEAELKDTARDSPSRFRESLARLRPKELERGLTLVGPHRDDVIFELNGLPAKGYASHGESWSFALSLKLAAAELLRRESATGDPVLILDDVFAELDQGRRKKLASAIGDYEQVLITAAVLDDVPGELTSHSVRIDSGAVVDE
jgi:DNA replication and repair protein RecF